MLLNEIKILVTETVDDKLRQAKDELAALKKKAGFVGQGKIEPQYRAQYDRLEARIKALKAEKEAELHKAEHEAASRKFDKEYAEKHAHETDEEKKKRHGEAISAGRKAAKSYKSEQDLAAAVLKIVRDASKDGQEKVTTSVVAQHFSDVTARTVDKWLEQPAFRKARALMGRD